jgi:hypothetical protein
MKLPFNAPFIIEGELGNLHAQFATPCCNFLRFLIKSSEEWVNKGGINTVDTQSLLAKCCAIGYLLTAKDLFTDKIVFAKTDEKAGRFLSSILSKAIRSEIFYEDEIYNKSWFKFPNAEGKANSYELLFVKSDDNFEGDRFLRIIKNIWYPRFLITGQFVETTDCLEFVKRIWRIDFNDVFDFDFEDRQSYINEEWADCLRVLAVCRLLYYQYGFVPERLSDNFLIKD